MPHAGTIRVLVAEDEEPDVVLLRRVLKGHPVRLEHVSSIDDLLVKAELWGPDLVLLDLHLGSEDPISMVLRVMEKVGDVPVIAWTGLDDEDYSIRAVEAGVSDYVIKGTYDGKSLMKRMRRALASIHARTERVRRATQQHHLSPEDLQNFVNAAVNKTLTETQVNFPAHDGDLTVEEVAAAAGTVKRWWPLVTAAISAALTLGSSIWYAKDTLDSFTRDDEVVDVIEAHQKQGHADLLQLRLDFGAHERKAEEKLEGIDKDRERTVLLQDRQLLKDDYMEDLLEWQAKGRTGARPRKPKELREIERKLITGAE